MAGIDWVRALPWLAAVAAMAAAGAWLARRHALRHGLLDQPGERRSHEVPTPRGGGIGIALAWTLACIVSALAGIIPGLLAVLVVSGVVLVAGAGYVDDHRPLSPWWRLAAHVLAGVLLAVGLAASGAAPWVAMLALAAVPVMVNVWNFMDGINGLAASQAALAALGFALMSASAPAALLALALVAACLGFLPFNFPRARIFLGDVGSGMLGFALAVLACLLLQEAPPQGGPGLLPLVFLPFSAFLIDAALTLAWRIVRGERWWTPHVDHAYQRLAARSGSHVPVTLAYGAWSTVAMVVAWVSSGQGLLARMAAAGACAVLGAVVWSVVQGQLAPTSVRNARR